MKTSRTYESVLEELEELRFQLQEATETIEAIRTGQVDALVVKNGNEHQLYTLKSADQTYRVFIEKMKEGAVTLNKDGIIVYSNSQFASMVNLPLAKVIGLSFLDFIPANLKEDFTSLKTQGWNSDSKGEIAIINKNNEPAPFLLSFASLELDEGRALSIILTDLTLQKQTEKQLIQNNKQLEEARFAVTKTNEHLEEIVKERTSELFRSREHFKFLADNIPVIVWTANPEGKADYFNKKWYEYTGLSLEESISSAAQNLLHPEDIEITMKAWKESIEKQQRFECEYRLKRVVDGAYRWHLVNGEPFKDETGNIVAWFGTATDIEDQKRELERKDEFISVASHELKTPLTSLKGYLHLIESEQYLTDETKSYISKGNISVKKLQHLIRDLLDVSKIKGGRLEFSMNPLNLTELIHNCIENSSYMSPSYKIKEEVEEDVFVMGNEERLEQVIMNLLNNAVKYSPDNKNIIVRLEKNERVAIVSIIDFGVGLSDSDQKRIFERFYRANSNKFSTSGLGIGLYISSQIIKEHNGQMTVKSKLTEGSVFSFLLPLTNKSK